MSKRFVHDSPPPRAMELFEPKPNVLYSLDATAISRVSPAVPF